MSGDNDFERYWLQKLARCIEGRAGAEVRAQVMAGSNGLSQTSDRHEVVTWTRGALERLEGLVDATTAQAILAGCACQYPAANLQPMRDAYAETGDVAVAHRLLQEQFESFLREQLALDEEKLADVVGRGWGAAGILHSDRSGGRIVATKIPKSGYLVEYMNEPDPARRRALYCHCPRVRDALQAGQGLPATYCYCGAGFYKGIWEEILQQPVEVELLESVLSGGEVCRVAIYLPSARGPTPTD
jgi:predicted hydrocarbon binding protein